MLRSPEEECVMSFPGKVITNDVEPSGVSVKTVSGVRSDD